MKTSELQGAALDWAVALIEHPEWKEQGFLEVFPHDLNFEDGATYITYAPSTDWSQGGSIIERERIAIWGDNDLYWEAECGWAWAKGPTPLVAAMRAYVALKLGEEVEALNELA